MVPVTLRQRPVRPMPPVPPVIAPGGGGPARDELLARLRDRTQQRPQVDPGLAGGLRAWLEDGAAALVAGRGEDAPPLYLGPRLLLGPVDPDRSSRGPLPSPTPLLVSCLVHALFRQLVTTGALGDPFPDALDALRLHPHRADLVRQITELNGAARAALAAEVTAQADHLRDLTPVFAPGWLPRTDDRVSIPLAGGRVVLSGVFDLLVGAPVLGHSSVCAVALTSGGPWGFARAALHYLALLETLRNDGPPFRLALLDSTVGRYVVEDLREEHLTAMVAHVVTRLSTLAPAHA